MRSHRTVSTLLPLVSTALEKPLSSSPNLTELVPRQQTWEDICNYRRLDDTDSSVAKDVSDNTGTGAWFDERLNNNDHRLWTRDGLVGEPVWEPPSNKLIRNIDAGFQSCAGTRSQASAALLSPRPAIYLRARVSLPSPRSSLC